MSRDRTGVARRFLLAVLVVVSGAVAWSLRRPSSRPAGPEPPGAPRAAQGTTVGDMSLVRFREGSRRIEVKARAVVGQEGQAMRLQGVEVSFPYRAQERETRATVTSDECLYEPGAHKAEFTGSVRVRTDDGFELDTESLGYGGEPGEARTEDPVTFRRGRASGSARGLRYRDGEGLQLKSEVRLLFEQEGQPPTRIEASSATMTRPDNVVRFGGGVVVRQGARELRSDRLQLTLNEDLSGIVRGAAIEDVELRIGAGASPDIAPAAGGEKHLRCRKLHLAFGANGVLQEAIAVNPATLEVLPGPHDAPERRRLEADQIRFGFDEQGRLVSLVGYAGGTLPRLVLVTEPLAGGRGGARRVESQVLSATFDPETGAIRDARFDTNVAFSQSGRKGWADRAAFDEGSGTVTLTGGEPRVVDEAEGSELRGRRIELGTRSGNVTARENVRHTVTRKGKAGRPGLLGGEEATVFLCHELDYDAAAKTARYRENALLRSGKDEIRAPLIVLEEPAEGRRRLTASGGVQSRLHPRPEKGKAKEPAPVEARSRELVYEEAAGRIVYTGDVEIRQGDILTRSPEAVVTLTKDGGAVDRMVAGEPVEVQQGARRATGQRGTYTPANETLVLVGEKVVLEDVDRRLEGRILTFEVGGDRIRVDGREEVRTEAVFKRKEPPTP
jgi:lipopolysaccharide export system protein LptA